MQSAAIALIVAARHRLLLARAGPVGYASWVKTCRVKPRPRQWRLLLALPLFLLVATADPAHADRKADRETAEKVAALPEKYRQFLAEVEILITPTELAAFLALEQDYQRDAFITNFWRSRDPYPDTARNELQDQWQVRLELAASLFGAIGDERAKMVLYNGPPDGRVEARCTSLWPVEVWFYDKKKNRTREELWIIFYQRFGAGACRIWQPDRT